MFKNFMNFRALLLACFVLLPFAAFAQVTVSGTVRESSGEPIIGASVLEKGTSNGAATDLNGHFSFKASSAQAQLVVSYVGFQNQTVSLAGRKNVVITMKTDDELLEDVVVVGYGTMKKKLVTGSTIQVKGEDIAKMNTTNALTAMQANAPGVYITQASSQPGKGFKVNIRGAGTNGYTSPLLIIDGIPSGTADDGLDGLNPNDIESIDVLKDAASCAIYGARGANGVILVTTKQGKAGHISIEYDGNVGWSNVYKRPATLGAQDYMKVVNESNFNTTGQNVDWSSLVPSDVMKKLNNGWDGTDWFDLYRNKNAMQTSHAATLSGGTDRSKFSLSVNYSHQNGVLGGDEASYYRRYGGRINSEHVLYRNAKGRDVITIGENISYWYHKSHQLAEGNGYWSAIQPLYSTSPLSIAYDADGNLQGWDENSGYSSMIFSNPYNGLANGQYNGINISRDFGVGATFYMLVEPIKGLVWRPQVNTGYSASNYRNWSQPYSVSSTNSSDAYALQMGASESSSLTLTNTLTYTFQNLGKHSLDIMIGNEIEKNMWNISMYNSLSSSSAKANSLLTKGLDYAWPSNYTATDIQGFSGSGDSQYSRAAFFGRLNYSYDDRYMLTAIIRRDGSSYFAKGHRWGTFPSVSAGWNIANESFMSGTRSWLDSFKIRGSWGQNGNDNVPYTYTYLANISYSPTDHADYGYKFSSSDEATANGTYQKGAYAANMANEDTKWETSEQLDLGFDASLLNSRLTVTFDWYRKTTKDLLIAAPILAMYGYPSDGAPVVNGGNIRNEGFELGIGWRDRIGKDFNYHINVNGATNKNRVTAVNNANGYINGPVSALFQNSDFMSRMEVDHPLGYFYGMSYSGIWQNENDILAAKAAGKAVLDGAAPGDPIWDDYNGDGKIDYDTDRHEIGNPHPDFTLGVNLGFDWKGFDFSVQGFGAFGMQVMQCYRTALLANQYLNYTTDVFDRWHGEGTSNTQPRLTIGSTNDQWVSTRYMQDADYFKIQNVTVGYDFARLWKNGPFSQLRVYAQAQNLYTFTGYTGVDPEVGSAGGQDDYTWVRGIDVGLYPAARTYLVGVNLKFADKNDKVTKEPVQPQFVEKEVVKEVVKEVPVEKVVKSTDLVQTTYVTTFEVNSSEIKDHSELDGIPAGSNVEVVAYASPEGNADANLALSQRRADAVAEYLKSKGINVTRVSAKGADTEHANRIAIVTVK